MSNILKAARWLAATPDAEKPHPVIPYLRKSFDLTPLQAVEAIREADHIKARST